MRISNYIVMGFLGLAGCTAPQKAAVSEPIVVNASFEEGIPGEISFKLKPAEREVKNAFYFIGSACRATVTETEGNSYRVDLRMRCNLDDHNQMGDSLHAVVIPREQLVLNTDFPEQYWNVSSINSVCKRAIPENASESFKKGLYEIVEEGMLRHTPDLRQKGPISFEATNFDDVCKKAEAYIRKN